MLPQRGEVMLNKLPILIVEDEPTVASDLASAIEAIDGVAVGPVATAADALELLDSARVEAAILATDVIARDAAPLALALIERGVPFVIHGAAGVPPALAARCSDVPVIARSARPTRVLAALLQRLSPDRARFADG